MNASEKLQNAESLWIRPGKATALWILVAGLLILIGWAKTINLVLLLGYLLLALLVMSAWTARRALTTVDVCRSAIPPLFAGEQGFSQIEICQRSGGHVSYELHDLSQNPPGGWFLGELPSGKTVTLTSPIAWRRRGVFPVPPLRLDCDYPYGIIRWQRLIPGQDELLILPALGRVNVEELKRWLLRTFAWEGWALRSSRRSRGGLGDVRGVRPFRPGDPIRDIHWKTTARRRQLMVREYDQSQPFHLQVLLDPWVPESHRSQHSSPEASSLSESQTEQSSLDWLASLAMSIAWSWRFFEEPGMLSILAAGWKVELRRGSSFGSAVAYRKQFRPLATLTGMPEPAVFSVAALPFPEIQLPRLMIATRADTPAFLRLRQAGVRAALIHPHSHLNWYLPPETAVMSSPLGEDAASAILGVSSHAE